MLRYPCISVCDSDISSIRGDQIKRACKRPGLVAQDHKKQPLPSSRASDKTHNDKQVTSPKPGHSVLRSGNENPRSFVPATQARRNAHTASHVDHTTASRTPRRVSQSKMETLGSGNDQMALPRPPTMEHEFDEYDPFEGPSASTHFPDMTGVSTEALGMFEFANYHNLPEANDSDAWGNFGPDPAMDAFNSIALTSPPMDFTDAQIDQFLQPGEMPGLRQPRLSDIGRQFVNLIPHDVQSCLDFVMNEEKRQVLKEPEEAFYLAAVAAMGDKRPALALSALECLVIIRAHHELTDGFNSYIQDVADTGVLEKPVPIGRAQEHAWTFVQACRLYRSCIEDGVREYASISINIPLQPQSQPSRA